MEVRHLAARLHAGQTDKGGRPYIEHLEAVATILLRHWPDAPGYAVAAAWLHDALEDTEATAGSLLADGVMPETIAIVEAVTRPAGSAYLTWIANLARSGNTWAVRVKLADNEHNSDPARRLAGSDIVERRYAPARRLLEAAA